MANIVLDFLHNYQTGERRETEPANAYQYDEGHVLEAVLPEVITACEIHYWIRGMEEAEAYTPTSITPNENDSCTVLGNIPNSYFETNGELRIYIVVTDGTASITTYEGKLHICQRSMPDDYVDDDPENEAVRVITEARAAAATATQKASDAAASAAQAQEILDSIPEDYSQLSEDVSDLKEDFHAYHSELGAGYADQIVSSIENTDQTPYNFRKVPYDATLEKVEGIVGVDLVLNQLITFAAGSYTTQGITVTKGNDGSMTFDGTATGNIYTDFYSNFQNVLTANHKYLFLFENPTGNATLVNSFGSPSITTKSGRIVPYAESQKVFLSVFIENGKTCDNEKVYPMVFDLTKTFGSQIADYAYSLEQSTAGSGVAWLKKHFSEIFDSGYIAHNPGEMVHVSGLSAHKTVGFNQCDEVWEVGTISSGTPKYATNTIRSKNFCPCVGGHTYHGVCGSYTNEYYMRIWWYDSEENYISGAWIANAVVTAPVNARFFKVSTNTSTYVYGNTYNHDICINLSDPAKNGTYEPYVEHTYPLDADVVLRGIPKLDAQNNLYYDGDEYTPDGEVNRRYGIVDLGTLNWFYDSVYTYFGATLSTIKAGTLNLICAKYSTGTVDGQSNIGDKAITTGTNSTVLVVRDAAYTDVASFKASLNGVLLVYELATPTTEQAEPYNPNQICDPNGTEEFISETVAPVGHVTRYQQNLRKKIEGLPWNFASLIAPTEAAFVATRNYTTGSLFIVNNVLYKATANIANGATITPGSNCTATTLAEVISALS